MGKFYRCLAQRQSDEFGTHRPRYRNSQHRPFLERRGLRSPPRDASSSGRTLQKHLRESRWAACAHLTRGRSIQQEMWGRTHLNAKRVGRPITGHLFHFHVVEFEQHQYRTVYPGPLAQSGGSTHRSRAFRMRQPIRLTAELVPPLSSVPIAAIGPALHAEVRGCEFLTDDHFIAQ